MKYERKVRESADAAATGTATRTTPREIRNVTGGRSVMIISPETKVTRKAADDTNMSERR
jgi:hypothetical protein